MSTASLSRSPATAARPLRRDVTPAVVVALALLVASAYGFLAAHPYRDLPAATVTGAHAQDDRLRSWNRGIRAWERGRSERSR